MNLAVAEASGETAASSSASLIRTLLREEVKKWPRKYRLGFLRIERQYLSFNMSF